MRQLGIDIATLTCRRVRSGPTLAQRAIALDRAVGSAFLACVAVTAFWLANQALPVDLLRMPLASESAQAAPGAPDMVLQELSAEAAARPLTRSDIKMLQGRLWSLGFDPGAIDGIAGRRTWPRSTATAPARAWTGWPISTARRSPIC